MSLLGVSRLSLISSAPASFNILMCSGVATYGSTPMGMSGYSLRTLEMTSTNLATVSSMLPTTPLVNETAFTSYLSTDSWSMSMILSVDRCLSSLISSNGEEQ